MVTRRTPFILRAGESNPSFIYWSLTLEDQGSLACLKGHLILCGVLHVTYHSRQRIEGQYMLCVLFKTHFLLAIANRSHTLYHVVAVLSLANIVIEKPDNGRGDLTFVCLTIDLLNSVG